MEIFWFRINLIIKITVQTKLPNVQIAKLEIWQNQAILENIVGTWNASLITQKHNSIKNLFDQNFRKNF